MLTKQQLEYATGRIEQICRDKLEALEVPNKSYTIAEVMALIKGNKAKPTDGSERRQYSPYRGMIEIAFDFTEAEDKTAKRKYETARARLYGEKTRIMDQLILGDAEEALKMIEAFAKF